VRQAKDTAEIGNEDFQLIQAFLDHDQYAFDRLTLKYQDRVFDLCFKMLGNAEDASDCAQETFIKVYRALGGFRFQARFTTWLYRIAVNTCKNKLASAEYRRRREMVALDNATRQDECRITERSGDFQAPEQIFEAKANTELIRDAIAALPERQKILIVLCDLEGQPYEEIARITGLRLGTVKSGLARARHRLRGALEGVIRCEVS
jgi:RNA polymerase sigma-70 factor (ECF subfamily)